MQITSRVFGKRLVLVGLLLLLGTWVHAQAPQEPNAPPSSVAIPQTAEQELLQAYATDDSATALIRYWFHRRRKAGRSLVASGAIAGSSVVIGSAAFSSGPSGFAAAGVASWVGIFSVVGGAVALVNRAVYTPNELNYLLARREQVPPRQWRRAFAHSQVEATAATERSRKEAEQTQQEYWRKRIREKRKGKSSE